MLPIAIVFIADLPILEGAAVGDVGATNPGRRFLRRAGAVIDGDPPWRP